VHTQDTDGATFPPCQTVEQIRGAESLLAARFGAQAVKRMLQLAAQRQLVRPVLLDILGDCIGLDKPVVDATAGLEADGFGELGIPVAYLRGAIGIDPILQTLRCVPSEDTLSAMLALVPESVREHTTHGRYLARLRALLRERIKTGRMSEGEEAVRRTVMVYALLYPHNRDLLDTLCAGPTEGALSRALAELAFVRLPAFVEQVVQLPARAMAARLLPRVRRTGAPSRVYTNVAAYLNQVETWEQYATVVHNTIPALCARLRVEPGVVSRVCTTLRSALADHDALERIRVQWFADPGLEPARLSYLEWRSYQERRRAMVVRERTGGGPLPVLYPRKDWLELLKGGVSRDCTSDERLALRQVLQPRFLNMRMVVGGQWMGNVYCLDLSRESGALVIDHVQYPHTGGPDWVEFFARLREELTGRIRAAGDSVCGRVLISTKISNHPLVNNAFKDYLRTAWCGKVSSSSMAVPRGMHLFESFRPGNRFLEWKCV
jgi:hypothetical protein